MSGGTYGYAYASRRWFTAHLKLVAEAMKDVEWEDSGDSGQDKTIESIQHVIDHIWEAPLKDLSVAAGERLGE